MSVINKMLRDLDARHALEPASASGAPFTRVVHSKAELRSAPSTRTAVSPWFPAMLVLVTIGAASSYLFPEELLDLMTEAPATPVRAVVAAPAVLPASEPSAPVEAVVPAALITADASVVQGALDSVAPSSQPLSHVAEQEAPLRLDRSLERSAPQAEPARTPARPLMVSNAPVRERAAAPLAAAQTQVPSARPAAHVLQRQVAVQETLGQAQNLWHTGSHEAAVELLRKAITVSEREQARPDSDSSSETVLLPLVRELARMELAQGRPAQVLQLLTRLEPVLSSHADLWAVRGNAAQRLGRYPESSQAYLAALQRRPDEPRWLLGAAVSLAAQGELVRAGELTEKARTAGAVSPEVLAYLRQAGVNLR